MSELTQAHATDVSVGLEIRRRSRGEEVVLALRGELDLGSVAALEEQLGQAQSARQRRVVLDLSGLEFMDSTGLQAVLRAQQRAERDGHQLVLCRGPSQVQRLFAVTGMLERVAFQD